MTFSSKPGETISAVEVSHISAHGVWLLARGEEFFMPYAQFPWFKSASVADILHVEEQSPGHYYWPSLDIDLTREIIDHPERFPLMSKEL